jgi:hypothetical protein
MRAGIGDQTEDVPVVVDVGCEVARVDLAECAVLLLQPAAASRPRYERKKNKWKDHAFTANPAIASS